jgi:GNAT superfamily N-acetyltransferase
VNDLDRIPYPFADVALARRLEFTEGAANRAFVEARAEVQPGIGACWMESDGALAMFDGPQSPLTQTFGLGLQSAPSPEQFDTIERFFRDRGAAMNHETSPLADAALVPALVGRGYRPLEYSTVLYRPAALPTPATNPAIGVIHTGAADAGRWADIAALGWGTENPQLGDFVRNMGRMQAAAAGFHGFVAEEEGRGIAAGGLFIRDGMALLAGASTIPSARRRGAQLALLAARLQYAVERGCDLAMIVALPGSGSQRNAERHGFRIAYTRVKWTRGGEAADPSSTTIGA